MYFHQTLKTNYIPQADHISSTTLRKSSCVVDKVPELASLSSISNISPALSMSNNAIVPIQCNEMFKRMSSDAKAEKDNYIKSIGDFVKEHLFKRLKFYNAELLLYTTKKSSICQKVCNHLNLAEAAKNSFWSTYSPCVESFIRVARNDAVQAMKSSFLGGEYALFSYQTEFNKNLTSHLFRFYKSLWRYQKCNGCDLS